MGENFINGLARLYLYRLTGYMAILRLNILHRLIKYLLDLAVLFPFIFQALPQLVDNFVAHCLLKRNL